MTNTTHLFDPDAMRLARKRVDEFTRFTDEAFSELIKEIGIISRAPDLIALASFCDQVGVNTSWDQDELVLDTGGLFEVLSCKDFQPTSLAENMNKSAKPSPLKLIWSAD